MAACGEPAGCRLRRRGHGGPPPARTQARHNPPEPRAAFALHRPRTPQAGGRRWHHGSVSRPVPGTRPRRGLGFLRVGERLAGEELPAYELHRAFNSGLVLRGPLPCWSGSSPTTTTKHVHRVRVCDHGLHAVRNEGVVENAEEHTGQLVDLHMCQGLSATSALLQTRELLSDFSHNDLPESHPRRQHWRDEPTRRIGYPGTARQVVA